MATNEDSSLNLVVKWAGKEYQIENISNLSTVNDLKSAIQGKTNVLPSRQKLLNLRFKGEFEEVTVWKCRTFSSGHPDFT